MPRRRSLRLVTPLTSMGVLGLGLLLLFLGYDWFWLVFALGFAVVVPVAALVTSEITNTDAVGRSDGTDEQDEDPLTVLKEQYARGAIDDAEFERRVDALLETESVGNAHEWAPNGSDDQSPERSTSKPSYEAGQR